MGNEGFKSEDDKVPSQSTPAERALAEARERRAKAAKQRRASPKEIGGRDGLEPTRYGDWEKGGIASDF